METLTEERVLLMIHTLLENPRITDHLSNQRLQERESRYLMALLPTGYHPADPMPLNAINELSRHYSEVYLYGFFIKLTFHRS